MPGRRGWAAVTIVASLLVGGLAHAAAQEPLPVVLIETYDAPVLMRNDCVDPPTETVEPGSFTLSRTGSTSETLTVAYTVVGEVVPTGGSVDFAVGESEATVALDLLIEPTDLDIWIEVLDGDAYDLGDPATVGFGVGFIMPICVGPPSEPPDPPVVEPDFAG